MLFFDVSISFSTKSQPLSNSRALGKFFELIPEGCLGECTQLELTETLVGRFFNSINLGTIVLIHDYQN